MVYEFFIRFLFQARSGSVIRRISWLTLIGMSLSVAALVLVISVMTALNDNVRERTLALEPHLFVEGADGFPDFLKVLGGKGFSTARLQTQDVILKTAEGRFRGAQGRGFDGKALQKLNEDLHRISFHPGQRVTKDEIVFDRSQVWIGVELADALDIRTGDELMVLSPEAILSSASDIPDWERVIVRGLLRTNISEIDGQGFFYSTEKSFRRLQGNPSLKQGLQVWLPDAEQASSMKKKWMKQFPGLSIQTWKERHSAIFFALMLERLMITIFLGLAALIASLSFVAVMSLLVSQRKKEIGILQALGLTPKQTRLLFFRIGLCLALAGLGIGLFLGCGLSLLLERFPLENVLPPIYFDTRIPARLDFVFSLVVAVGGAFLSALGAWAVSSSIKNQTPVSLIR